MNALLLFLASFLASTVEVVEAFTIVLAVGLTRGWRQSLFGVAAASVTLVAVVGILGPSLVVAIPLHVLQVVVGLLLLIFGMQWVRKAVLRRAGLKALHNEDAIFAEDVKEFAADIPLAGFDWQGFTLSYKGVFLEGLEVAFIVLTFGANSQHLAFGGRDLNGFVLSGLGAFVAFALVLAAGALVRHPLSRVPENDLKFAVGVLLTSFGTFWLGEGAGIDWVLSDGMIIVLAVLYTALAFGLSSNLASRTVRRATPAREVAS
jgi:uncharacterized membrane protein